MSNIVLPEVGANETVADYIKRLVETEVIKPYQINLAIQKFQKK